MTTTTAKKETSLWAPIGYKVVKIRDPFDFGGEVGAMEFENVRFVAGRTLGL